MCLIAEVVILVGTDVTALTVRIVLIARTERAKWKSFASEPKHANRKSNFHK